MKILYFEKPSCVEKSVAVLNLKIGKKMSEGDKKSQQWKDLHPSTALIF